MRDANVLDPAQKLIVNPKRKYPTMWLGSLSQRFFLKGEQQEASGYKDVVLDDPDKTPTVEFQSFDKIPRKRRPLLVLLALASLAGGGAVTWRSLRGLWQGNAWVKAASQAMVRASRGSLPPPTPPPPPAPMSIDRAVESIPAEIPRTETPPAETPPAETPPVLSPLAVSPPVVSPPAETPPAKPPRARPPRVKPLRGYVWSPAANALVPVARRAASAGPRVPVPDDDPPLEGPPAPKAPILE